MADMIMVSVPTNCTIVSSLPPSANGTLDAASAFLPHNHHHLSRKTSFLIGFQRVRSCAISTPASSDLNQSVHFVAGCPTLVFRSVAARENLSSPVIIGSSSYMACPLPLQLRLRIDASSFSYALQKSGRLFLHEYSQTYTNLVFSKQAE